MRQQAFDFTPRLPQNFDGATFDVEKDERRLSGLPARVFHLMRDGAWRSLGEIQKITGGSEAGVSARLRDLRKQKFGGHRVDRRRREGADGLWEYRVVEANQA